LDRVVSLHLYAVVVGCKSKWWMACHVLFSASYSQTQWRPYFLLYAVVAGCKNRWQVLKTQVELVNRDRKLNQVRA